MNNSGFFVLPFDCGPITTSITFRWSGGAGFLSGQIRIYGL
jgi:hypothetical protein